MFDMFGASAELSFKGSTRFRTLGGSFVTILMTIFILAYFCLRAIQVSGYGDPQISSYDIMEDRSKMEKALKVGEMHTNFVFGFLD